MLKQIVGFCLFTILSMPGLGMPEAFGSVSEENAADLSVNRISDRSVATPESTIITGTVRFEKRFTRVSELECEREPCAQSQAYWSLEIDSGQNRYVLNQITNLGEEHPPEFMRVGEVPLRPGTRVKVEGLVIKGSSYFILLAVNKVELLMD